MQPPCPFPKTDWVEKILDVLFILTSISAMAFNTACSPQSSTILASMPSLAFLVQEKIRGCPTHWTREKRNLYRVQQQQLCSHQESRKSLYLGRRYFSCEDRAEFVQRFLKEKDRSLWFQHKFFSLPLNIVVASSGGSGAEPLLPYSRWKRAPPLRTTFHNRGLSCWMVAPLRSIYPSSALYPGK